MARMQTTAARRSSESKAPEFGWRYLKVIRSDGTEDTEIVPLREEDLLHPQEEDFIVHNDNHFSDVFYVLAVFRAQTANQTGIRILGDHIVDFQQGGVQPLGPDITVLNGEQREWDGARGTFPVGDMKARVLFVVEITSPSTRRKDLGPKLNLYYRAGIPLYVIADAPYGGSRKPLGIQVYQAGPEFYEPLPTDDAGRFWLDVVDVSLGIEEGRVACFDADGNRIGNYTEIADDLKQEKARAEQEKARAEQEKARAEAAEAEIRELKAQLKKPKRRKT